MKKYIHYGHKNFDRNLFVPITNRKDFAKPIGGLWASATDAKYGWKDWCKDSNFCECKEENSFKFILSDNARVLKINTISDTKDLPKADSTLKYCMWTCLDFEKLKEEYDAIEIDISGDGIYFGLYGWDCDSILIMNPDVVIIK